MKSNFLFALRTFCMSDDKSQRNRLSCWRLHSAYFLAYKSVTQKRLKYNVLLNLKLCVTLKRDASHKCDKIEISKKNFNKRWQKICGVSLSSMITFCSIFQWTSIYLAIKYVTQAMQCYHFQIRNQLFLDGSTGFCTWKVWCVITWELRQILWVRSLYV